MLTKIISGGQTGADQGGLEAGRLLKLPTGGYAPQDWRTEEGNKKELLQGFGLTEYYFSGYPPRTKANVHNSDGTVIFFTKESPGSKQTLSVCKQAQRPFITNPSKEDFLAFLELNNIKTLNVAGNRESVSPGIQERVKCFLIQAL